MSTATLAPWERQPGEPPRAFAAFARYRDLGPGRSLARVAEDVSKVGQVWGKRKSVLNRWSAVHGWVKRAAAWDAFLDRQRQEATVDAVREMAERHAKVAATMGAKVVERLRAIDPQTLSASDLARWFEIAVRIERLSRGLVTERTEATARVTLEDDERPLTREEMLARLAAEDDEPQ